MKERRGTGKDGGKEQERNRKGTGKEQKGIGRKDFKAKQKQQTCPILNPIQKTVLTQKKVGGWGGLKSHYILYYKPPCQVSPADGT